MSVIYAIGDIHGRRDLLDILIDHIRDYHGLVHAGPAELMFLGDYVDHGPDSKGVIDRLMAGVDGFQTTCLLGNHEAMLLECLYTRNRLVWDTWISNGGSATLASLGVPHKDGDVDPDQLVSALGEDRIQWLDHLPLWQKRAGYIFVHAGIVPGVPVEDQLPKDLLWIRGRFLDSDADHGATVIHGHTPGDAPVIKPNRICVDTATASGGLLTAAVLTGEAEPVFLRAG